MLGAREAITATQCAQCAQRARWRRRAWVVGTATRCSAGSGKESSGPSQGALQVHNPLITLTRTILSRKELCSSCPSPILSFLTRKKVRSLPVRLSRARAVSEGEGVPTPLIQCTERGQQEVRAWVTGLPGLTDQEATVSGRQGPQWSEGPGTPACSPQGCSVSPSLLL